MTHQPHLVADAKNQVPGGTRIPVTVVTGFLGAGKSTLLARWLQQLPRTETAVIVNERGEVGIDGELLASHVSRLRELTGGCVCCSSQAELVGALAEFSEADSAPRRIFVETSGAATPAGVIRGITSPRLREHLSLDGVVTVVDATRVPATLKFDLALEQLAFADVVVLSHADGYDTLNSRSATASGFHAIRQRLKSYAPTAVFAESRRGELVEGFGELMAARRASLHDTPEQSHHTPIDAVSLKVDGELNEERFTEWVEQELGDVESRILRVKGIVAMQGVEVRVILQGVGQAVDVQLGAAWEEAARNSRLVVLGLGLDAPRMEAGFEKCRITPA